MGRVAPPPGLVIGDDAKAEVGWKSNGPILLLPRIVPVMAEEPANEIEALTERIGKAIKDDALPEDICILAEARAWLIWPNQPH